MAAEEAKTALIQVVLNSVVKPLVIATARKYGILGGVTAEAILELSNVVGDVPPLPRYLRATKKIPVADTYKYTLLAQNVQADRDATTAANEVAELYPYLSVLSTGLSLVMDEGTCRETFWQMVCQTQSQLDEPTTRLIKACRFKTLKELARRVLTECHAELGTALAGYLETVRGVGLPPIPLHRATPTEYAELWLQIKQFTLDNRAENRTIRIVNGSGFEGICAVLATMYKVTIQIGNDLVAPQDQERVRNNRIRIAFEYRYDAQYEMREHSPHVKAEIASALVYGITPKFGLVLWKTVVYLAVEEMIKSNCDILHRALNAQTALNAQNPGEVSVALNTIALNTLQRFSRLLAGIFASEAGVETETLPLMLSWRNLTLLQLHEDSSTQPWRPAADIDPDQISGYGSAARNLLYLAFLGAVFSPVTVDDFLDLELLVDCPSTMLLPLLPMKEMVQQIPDTIRGYISEVGDRPNKANMASIVQNSFKSWLYPSFLCDKDIASIPWPPIQLIPDPFTFPAPSSAPWSGNLLGQLRNVKRLISANSIGTHIPATDDTILPNHVVPPAAHFGTDESIDVVHVARDISVNVFRTMERDSPIILELVMMGLLENPIVRSHKTIANFHGDRWKNVSPIHTYNDDDPRQNQGHRFAVASYRNNVARRLAIYAAATAQKRTMLFVGKIAQQGLGFAEDNHYQVVIF